MEQIFTNDIGKNSSRHRLIYVIFIVLFFGVSYLIISNYDNLKLTFGMIGVGILSIAGSILMLVMIFNRKSKRDSELFR